MPSGFSFTIGGLAAELISGTSTPGQRTRDQLFRIVDILPPAIDTLVAARPGAAAHIYAGRYGDLIAGWGAQAAIVRARLASEVLATRLRLATGRSLEELAASEFWAQRDSAPTFAVGNVTISRTKDNASSSQQANFTAGEIRQGHRFRKVADPALTPAVEEAEYALIEPVAMGRDDTFAPQDLGGGQWRHTQTVVGQIRATRSGPHANRAILPGEPAPAFQSVDQLFDPTITLGSNFRAASGSLNVPEETLRQFARAMYTGRLGPTRGALVAGAFSYPGIAHVETLEDTNAAISRVFVADESWGASEELNAAVKRHLLENWVGFGGRCEVGLVENTLITVDATCILRDPSFREDKIEINQKIRDVVVDYFDNKPKWWTFRLTTIGGRIGAADHRILACTSVIVRRRSTGEAMPEPSSELFPGSTFVDHFMVANDGVRVSYAEPS
jgi:hypothetical protein